MRRNDQPIRPDDVSDQFPEGAIQLVTRMVPASSEGDDVPTIVIEGDAVSLEYLAKVILVQAAFPLDCGYGISPKGAGNVFFRKGSEVGLYFHRLPCMDNEVDSATDRMEPSADSNYP